MKRIGLTQRAHSISGISERRDMLDQRWTGLIERLGGCPLPLANTVQNPEMYLEALGIDGLVMTGGNDIATLADATDGASERDKFEAAAYAYCTEKGIPVLGVCRGAQMINQLSGGRMERMPNHVAQRHAIIWSDVLPSSWHCPPAVNSYHGWAIPADGLAPRLTAAAWASDRSVEAFYSTDAAVTGIIWHPEREDALSSEALAFLARALGLDDNQFNAERPE
ncbi:gamma-glutamyl-gamma-aminobutyrate hydrolase family protein [Rhizobium sp. BE258]|uniref:gamma-glutamyl-gamma-aminobutyrate hydrolase family protein n=1 Tax=Rhizobium sp. BE258 TaxID=2817722 RepID=UPI002862A120|nr:gamma-glutamyl-gamma-aminobutyrate hydrolase family protein [Rhizobium sp. BE258]MDR7142201.1 putative glutamine amidotransferase [Rhizobium sp. BE258]